MVTNLFIYYTREVVKDLKHDTWTQREGQNYCLK